MGSPEQPGSANAELPVPKPNEQPAREGPKANKMPGGYDAQQEAQAKSGESEQMKKLEEKLTSGKEVVATAVNLMQGDSKEVLEKSTEIMPDAQKENLGSLFLHWIKTIVPRRAQFMSNLMGRMSGGEEDVKSGDRRGAGDVRDRSAVVLASESMANSVNRYIHQFNNEATEHYLFERAWEQQRATAQAEFEQSANPEERGAMHQWFENMNAYLEKSLKSGRRLSGGKKSEKEQSWAASVNQRCQGEEAKSWLQNTLEEGEKKNLLYEAKDVSEQDKSQGTIVLRNQQKEEIKTIEQIPKEGVTLIISPKGKETVKTLRKPIVEAFPNARLEEEKGSLSVQDVSVEQARKIIALIGRTRSQSMA